MKYKNLFDRISTFLILSVTLVGFVAVQFPAPRASAQAASGPTKRLIVRFNNVLGANTNGVPNEPTQLPGYINELNVFNNIPYGVYSVDSQGEQSLRNSPYITDVIEDEILEFLFDGPTVTVGGDPVDGSFTDSGTATDYDGSGFAVAIIDTGVDKNHASLAGKVLAEACFGVNDVGLSMTSLCPGGAEFSDAVNSGLDCDATFAGCGHGTNVAGATAMANASFDIDGDLTPDLVSGVAKGAQLIAIKVGSYSNSPLVCGAAPECSVPMSSSVLGALNYLVTLDVGIPIAAANVSIGGSPYAENAAECNGSSAEMFETVYAALKLRRIAPVVATGNSGGTPGNENKIGSSACVESAIAVGATNILGDSIASYSNNGPLTDLLAPGGDYDGLNDESLIWLPVNETPSSFEGTQGTSFATPMTTGAYAVLREKHPLASVDQLTGLLQSSGVDILENRAGYTAITKKMFSLSNALSTSTLPTLSSFTGPAGNVNEGADVALTVASADIASCSLDNGIGNVDVSSGTITVEAFAAYNLTCLGDFNDSVSLALALGTFNTRPTVPSASSDMTFTTDSATRTASITWEESTDPDGIDNYQVFLNGDLIDTTEGTTLGFTDLDIGLDYTAEVFAVDTLGAVSLPKSQGFVLAAVTTPAVPDTGLFSIFSSLNSGMVLSTGAVMSTGTVLFFSRRYF